MTSALHEPPPSLAEAQRFLDPPDPARVHAAISDHVVTLCFGRNCRDTSPRQETLTMRELAARFSKPDTCRGELPLAAYLALKKSDKAEAATRAQEKDGEYFIAASFARAGTRTAADIKLMYCFVMDIDTGQISKEFIRKRLQGLQYIAYSSYSHQKTDPRWRVVVPYAAPIAPAEHLKVYDFFQKQFDKQLDPRCKTLNQLWYTPACPTDAVDDFEFFTGTGDLLDVNLLPELEPEPEPHRPTAQPEATPERSGSARGRSLSLAELTHLREALARIPSDDRQVWIKVGLALRRDVGDEAGLELWLEWSAKSDKFDKDDAVDTWDTLAVDDREAQVTLGTVFHLAKEHGWTTSAAATPDFVVELNREHFMAMDGGKTWIFREANDVELGRSYLERIRPADFKTFYANQQVLVPTSNGVTMQNKARAWIDHAGRRSYHAMSFLPGKTAPLGHYNLWQGFPIAPKRGKWTLLRKHITDVICNGDREAAEYLLGWMAWAVQNPDRPAEVAVVMQGARGTGKGKLASLFGKLFGAHTLQVVQARHLTGNFNAHLRTCIFLFVDEALWAGDKAGENVLKGLITERTLAIEGKGENITTVPNRLHVMMASNNDWVVPAGAQERRYFVVRVGEQRMQDHAYFAAIDQQMLHEGGLAAMMYDLLHRDLSSFDIRKVPQTSELDQQILRSLDADVLWWLEHLGKTLDPADWKYQPRVQLQLGYAHALGENSHGRSTATRLGMMLGGWVPGGRLKKVKRPCPSSGVQQDCYEFPDQQTCKDYLKQKLGLRGDPWA